MKAVIFYVVLMFSSSVIFIESNAQPSGVIGTDAVMLEARINEKDTAEILRILTFYIRDENDSLISDMNAIIARVEENTFLREALSKNGILQSLKMKKNASAFLKSVRNDVHRSPADVQGVLGTLFPASTVADGLGTFIAERFKEELTMRYLENFRKKLTERDSIFFYSKLFPSTFDALLNYPNVFEYKALMTVLKEAFKDDLDNIGQNFLPFLDMNLTRANLISPTVYGSLFAFDLFINKMPQSSNALNAIAGLRQNEYFQKISDTSRISKAFVLTSFVAQELRNNTGYLSTADIQAFMRPFTGTTYTQVFVGLFLEKKRNELKKVDFSGRSAYDFLNNIGKTTSFLTMIKSLTQIQVTVQAYQNADENKNIAAVAHNLNTNLRTLITSLTVFVPNNTISDINNSLALAEHIYTAFKLAKEEKYGLVIVEILKTLDATALKEKQPYLYEILNKYGLFIANVAQAKNGQEVKEALDVAALPVGSYKIKRNALADISFNAFPGISFGTEFRSDIPVGEDIDEVSTNLAFSVPVGLAFSWGGISKREIVKRSGLDKPKTSNDSEFKIWEENGKKYAKFINGYSHSVFISVLDIGAVTAFRLNDDDTEKLPEFTWENILAPGLYYVLGLKDTPLSMGIGAQYGPQLRKLNDSEIEISSSLITARIFLSVDIPIFNFFTRTSVKIRNQDDRAFYK